MKIIEFIRHGRMMNMKCLVCDEDSYDICPACGRNNEQYSIEDDNLATN